MVKPTEHADAFEARVRQALHREAGAIEPSGDALGAIQARTAKGAAGRARGRWFVGGTAVLATAAAVTAIALVGSGDLGLGGDEAAPAGPAAKTRPLQIFYLDSTPERRGEPGSESVGDPGLYREVRDVTVESNPVEAAVRELAASTPEDVDYVNPWAAVSVGSVDVQDDVVVVGVDKLPAAGPGRGSALQALAHTVQAASQAGGAVRVSVDVEEGTDGADPVTVTAGDPVGTYAGIWVTNPEQGGTASSPVTFSGMAATFEGNVAYEIKRGEQVVASGATISAGGMGVWSEWSFTERLQPGEYTLVAFDEDPALGGRRDIDTKDFTVR